MGNMKVIEKTQNRIIVEHDNFRSMVTYEMFGNYQNGVLTADDLLNNGVPISVQWSDFLDINVTAKDVENELYRRGIHTVEDLLNKQQAVTGAILAAMGETAGTIYKKVKKSKR